MADKIKSIYVDEMIDKWKYWNICPIVDGKIDFLEDHPLNEGIWGKDGSEFLHKHFKDGVKKSFKKLNTEDEIQFGYLALRHNQMYSALRDYIVMLHVNECEFSETMHWIAARMLLGEVFRKNEKGASAKGVYGKYKWRDILIACTIDVWRDLHDKLPVKNDDYDEDKLTICSIIHAAFQKLTPENEEIIKPDRIYKIYLKERKS